MSLWYTLFRRLCEGKPTAFQCEPGNVWTFNNHQARWHPVHRADMDCDLPNGAWALCDSNSSLNTPSEFIVSRNFFTIQTTSPQQDRYTQWIKEKKGLCYYMEVFSEPEIKQLGHVGSSFSYVI